MRAFVPALVACVAAATLSGQAASAAPAAPAPAEFRRCPGIEAQVSAALEADFADACAGARQAAVFFTTLGRPVLEPLSIEVTPVLPPEVGPTAAGCFMEKRRRAYILPYAEFRKRRTWFNVPVNRGLYRSLATHEAAHALAACHFSVPSPTIQAKEYLAYVAMFSAMDAGLRARVLRSMPGRGFDDESHINAMIYLFDPMGFGAEAWRHYLKPGVGTAFAQAVLAGRVLLD